MSKFRNIVVVTAAAAALTLGAAAPAFAAGSGGTGTTFALTGGALSITVPATSNLGTQATGATTTISGALGAVQVTDARGLLAANWNSTAATTAFTTGGGTAAETVPASAATYTPGATTARSGLATFAPGPGGVMTASQPAYVETLGVGNNSATWDPTIAVAVPAGAVAGTYSATLTHSVL
ncbi:MAG: hypothetical protein QOE59_4243 [Actinomycetota bacterium]|nr:hypothetical protein [Actinomycetota bacterium]